MATTPVRVRVGSENHVARRRTSRLGRSNSSGRRSEARVGRALGVGTPGMSGLLVWAGASLLIDAWVARRHRPSLTERLSRHQPSVAREAAEWLGRQG